MSSAKVAKIVYLVDGTDGSVLQHAPQRTFATRSSTTIDIQYHVAFSPVKLRLQEVLDLGASPGGQWETGGLGDEVRTMLQLQCCIIEDR